MMPVSCHSIFRKLMTVHDTYSGRGVRYILPENQLKMIESIGHYTNEDGIWFEEGMCFYLPRKLLLNDKVFDQITIDGGCSAK